MMVAKKTYTIQENGQITLPAEWRRRYGLKKGDPVMFKETEEGLLISPKEAQVLSLLDEIGESLKAKGITLEELIESGREIRQELYEEKYARDSDE
jgi:AbrB family looped-hinge helix DNA binding protein